MEGAPRMAADDPPRQPTRPRRRRAGGDAETRDAPSRRRGAGSSTSRRTSSGSASGSEGPLGLEPVPPFVAGEGDESAPAPAAALEQGGDYEPPPPQLIEWTPERAAAIVRGAGYLLHASDGVAREPGGERLWRATEEDAAAIGPPLARILNRYDAARRLAGVSDEAELTFALGAYAKRNLALRGRLLAEKAEREAERAAPELFLTPERPGEADEAGGSPA
jgi:hypothetical protein